MTYAIHDRVWLREHDVYGVIDVVPVLSWTIGYRVIGDNGIVYVAVQPGAMRPARPVLVRVEDAPAHFGGVVA